MEASIHMLSGPWGVYVGLGLRVSGWNSLSAAARAAIGVLEGFSLGRV